MSKYDPEKYKRNKHKYQTPEYRATAKAWRDRNREHLREYTRKWFAENKEYRKEYNQRTKEHHREVMQRWYDDNKGKMIHNTRLANGMCANCDNERLEHSKKFCFEHWLADKAGYHIGSRSKETRQVLLDKLEACNYTCPYTGDKLVPGLNCSLDHIQPSSRFPELATDLNNVEWVTYAVNKAKQDMTKGEFIAMCKTVASRF